MSKVSVWTLWCGDEEGGGVGPSQISKHLINVMSPERGIFFYMIASLSRVFILNQRVLQTSGRERGGVKPNFF